MWRRALKRLAADPHVLLAVAVVLAAMVIEWASQGDTLLVAVPSLVFLGVQVGLGLRPTGGSIRGSRHGQAPVRARPSCCG